MLPTRILPFDRVQGGGLGRGSFVELAGTRSSGRFALMLATLAAATQGGEGVALVDLGDHLDPKSAENAGVDLRRLLWVRPRSVKESVMSAEMILGAGFTVVALDLGSRPIPLHRVPPAVWVRLARAAEDHNGILLLMSPTPIRPPSVTAVITADSARGVWQGKNDEPRLLSGIAARLTAVRRKGAHEIDTGGLALGVRESLGWAEGA